MIRNRIYNCNSTDILNNYIIIGSTINLDNVRLLVYFFRRTDLILNEWQSTFPVGIEYRILFLVDFVSSF